MLREVVVSEHQGRLATVNLLHGTVEDHGLLKVFSDLREEVATKPLLHRAAPSLHRMVEITPDVEEVAAHHESKVLHAVRMVPSEVLGLFRQSHDTRFGFLEDADAREGA